MQKRQALIAAREDQDKTQAEFAKKLGIPRGTYACIEAGSRTPSFRVACQIAKELGRLDDMMDLLELQKGGEKSSQSSAK